MNKKTAQNGPTETAWLGEERPEAEKLIRSSLEALLLLQWQRI